MTLHEAPQGRFALRKITVVLSVILTHRPPLYQGRAICVNKIFALIFAGIVQTF
jgi:hypothetical protein